jgi:dephospho-CoA kinase
MNVIGISGLPGSGKSLASEIAKERSISVINMGDLVREESKKRNMNMGETSIKLRKELGDYILANLTIEKIKNQSLEMNSEKPMFLIEGIRSQDEVKIFRENFKNFILLSIFASPLTRFDRVQNRKRNDDSKDHKNFIERDQKELDFGIGNVIATSDCIIINESEMKEYEAQVNNFLDKIS